MYILRTHIKLLLITVLFSFLTGCAGDEGDDLDQFMANAANTMSRSVKPLPEVQSYSPLPYNIDGILVDPFMAKKASKGSGSLQPNTSRPRELLESFPLESLFYVGSLSKKKLKYALIKTPEGVLQRVKVGNYMGPNFGLITSIGDDAVTIKEIVQDDVTGEWVEREAIVELQE